MSGLKLKTIIISIILGISAIVGGFEYISFESNQYFFGCVTNIYQTEYNYFFKEDGCVIVVGNMSDSENLTRYLKRLNLNKIDYFICSSFEEIYKGIKIDKVLICDLDIYNFLGSSLNCIYMEENKEHILSSLSFKFTKYSSAVSGINLVTQSNEYFVATNKLSLTNSSMFVDGFSQREIKLCGKESITKTYEAYLNSYEVYNIDLSNILNCEKPFENWTIRIFNDMLQVRSLD